MFVESDGNLKPCEKKYLSDNLGSTVITTNKYLSRWLFEMN